MCPRKLRRPDVHSWRPEWVKRRKSHILDKILNRSSENASSQRRRALASLRSRLEMRPEHSAPMVRNFERGVASSANTIEAIQRALEDARVIWIDANDGGRGDR
jgi:hypothetical protein